MTAKTLFILLPFIFAACSEPIEVRRLAKEKPFGGAAPAGPVAWPLPEGWTQVPGQGIRVATLKPPQDAGALEVTVVSMAGDGGGELANVNRWRGQVGLGPIGAEALSASRKRLSSSLGSVFVYDLAGKAADAPRFIIGSVSVEGSTWYFKMAGQPRAAGRHKAAFLKLLEGLTKNVAS